jgi:23S rRNA pseudouridine1911/1915/1917 synthase
MNRYEILYEDDAILIANKYSPIPVQKDKSGDESLQDLLLAEHLKPGSFLEAAHRIDRRTSGIVLFGKTHKALATLEEQFRDRSIQKTYIACLEKEPLPHEGTLEHRIVQNARNNTSLALDPSKAKNRGFAASLNYRLVMKTDRYFFIEAVPLTGRHHQIRAQCAAMGWPIKGDLKYGARRSTASGRIMLHAWKIALEHPSDGKPLSCVAALPDDETLWKLLTAFLEEPKQS